MTRVGLERPVATEEVLASIERRCELDVLRTALAAASAGLRPETRQAVELRVLDELSYPEVAARLGTSEATARARVSRGLHALGRRLEAHEPEEARTT